MYSVEAVPAGELGNASFLVADTDRGMGLVIDPLRDIERYVKLAADLGVKLTHALDTHLHNDYVSGRRELAAELGTNIDDLEPGSELHGRTARPLDDVGSRAPHHSVLSDHRCHAVPGSCAEPAPLPDLLPRHGCDQPGRRSSPRARRAAAHAAGRRRGGAEDRCRGGR